MPAAPQKFTFDLDLGRRNERSSVVSETTMATLVQQARTEGFASGFAEGERTASVRAANRLAAAAEALAARAVEMGIALDAARAETLREATDLAATVARKLSRALLMREPTAEIADLITECLASLGPVPHLVIRCAPDLADAVRDIATTRASSSGFAGRLIVMGEPEIGLGDARIEWAEGGLVRDLSALSSEIDARIADYLAAHGAEAKEST